MTRKVIATTVSFFAAISYIGLPLSNVSKLRIEPQIALSFTALWFLAVYQTNPC